MDRNFITERNNILKNLEKPEVVVDIEKYCKKYDIPMPQDTVVVLAGLHKARLYVTSEDITEEMKNKSRRWLNKHNFSENIN